MIVVLEREKKIYAEKKIICNPSMKLYTSQRKSHRTYLSC